MAKASGTIFRTGGKERISHATIKVTKGGRTEYATAGEGGEFSLDLPEPGSWTLVAFEKGSFTSDPVQVQMDQDQVDIKMYLDRIAETVDDKAGRIFFWILIGVLGGLISLYLVLHLRIFNTGQGFEIWSKDPLRFLEIILWGLAGILVSKIITIGWYLRSHRYYREGILMHIAHIVATPILVLVVVLLLSQVVLKFTLANSNEISIDLSVPTIMVAFAFIIGTSPWPLWNFILNMAKRFTGQLEKGT
jgi:hypothetical protein